MPELNGGDPFASDLPLVTYSGGTPDTDFSAQPLFKTVHARQWASLIRPYCEEAPLPVVENAVRYAAIQFCERTRAWRYIVSASFEENNEVIIAPDYATIHEIENAWWNDSVELVPTQFTEALPEDLNATEPIGTPRYITQMSPNTVTVLPLGEGTLRLTVFLKPRSGHDFVRATTEPIHDYYDQVPEFLFVQWGEVIAWGALARILMLPRKEWSDAERAVYFERKFEAAMDSKSSMAIQGQQRSKRRANIHFY